MTEKELRKFNRRELLELLILKEEQNEKLRSEVERLTGELENRTVRLSEVGSIAEASMKLTDVFAEAEKAAAVYLDNVRRLCEEKEAESAGTVDKAVRKASAILTIAYSEAERVKSMTEEQTVSDM